MRLLALIVVALSAAAQQSAIRTPKAGPEPRIHGPLVYGARPGNSFLYRIPATGVRPMRWSAKELPRGLDLNRETGIISGHTPVKHGDYTVQLRAENRHGQASRPLRIVVGDTIALTPPMGWNTWYSYYCRATDEDVRRSALALVDSGLANFGYSYVGIDGCWSAPGKPLGARSQFPDMKALTGYIHSLGLKTGIYSSPGPVDCEKYPGSYKQEAEDARQFADWGFDLLKYDWCSYGKVASGPEPEKFIKPYRLMGGILKGIDRDIVFNICQYGRGDVWRWARSVGGQTWRTTGDLGLEKNSKLPPSLALPPELSRCTNLPGQAVGTTRTIFLSARSVTLRITVRRGGRRLRRTNSIRTCPCGH